MFNRLQKEERKARKSKKERKLYSNPTNQAKYTLIFALKLNLNYSFFQGFINICFFILDVSSLIF